MVIGEIVLGSFLGSFFQVLLNKLASFTWGYVQREGISTALFEEWKGMLVTINVVLADAEDKQVSDDHPVKLWLDNVKDLAYDMDDLLDEIEIKAAQVELEAKFGTRSGQEKWKLFSFFGRHKSSGSNPDPCSLVSETKVQKIGGRLKAIVTEKDHLGLRENVGGRSNSIDQRVASTSLLESPFFGRKKEEAEILELLITEVENSNVTPSIIPIVGMGGIGKTALAQRLFNDARVEECFGTRAWICVSDVFDVFKITKTILHKITRRSYKSEDLDELQVELRNNLSEKKFLVVLDDTWNKEYGKWTALLEPFKAGARGSKIIVTTRNLDDVPLTGELPYHLEKLSHDDCTSLLAFHAFGEINFESHREFETIGKKIAKRCKGLPLAAKILGRAIHKKPDPDVWDDAFNNLTWDLRTAENEVLPILKLSYVHLPSYLKRCFSYCAVFPKDYEIERDELVLLWIAEGFLDGPNVEENKLRSGRNYFDELVFRSFLQQSSADTSKFSMHDLLNDLAKSIEGRTCFSSWESQLAINTNASLEKARYASFISSQFVTSKCLRAYHGIKVLRSLFLVHVGSSGGSLSISNKVLNDLLTNLEYLRVFSLCHCDIVEVPHCVGKLKHLRHLNFSYTSIKRLPDSICGLYKLQALILRGCQQLSILPPGITNMASLQFLDIRDTPSLNKMPLGISNLNNLSILSKFVVGKEKGLQLKELKNLRYLQGELFISELQNVEEVIDVVDANLFGKQGLRNLLLHWDKDFGNHSNRGQLKVLDSLRPHTKLESLTISHYGGEKFPSWLNCPSYSKIVSLCLRGCRNVVSLPQLGQLPSLKKLSLEGLHSVRTIGFEFYGDKRPFPSLTTLNFEEMLVWKDWYPYVKGLQEEASFSYLQHLVIRNCLSLVGTLPRQLDHLMKLEIHSCPLLKDLTSNICFPSLCELHITDCKKEVLRSLVHLTSLTILRIEKLADLVCFDHGIMSRLVKLKELHIKGCGELTYLWQDGKEMLNLIRLQRLAVVVCCQFSSFVAGGGAIELPCNLERMELIYCPSLQELPSKMHTLRHLHIEDCPKIMRPVIPADDPSRSNPTSQVEPLEIGECDSLTSFPFVKGRFLALKTFYINECDTLGSLPQCLHTLSHLSRLEIMNCSAPEIENFPPLPITLSGLRLWECPKIKSIASCNIASCKHLTELSISDCPELEIEDFPPLPTALSRLTLQRCPKIKSLPNQLDQLTSLQELRITDCQSITCFPRGGLPPNLRNLHIYKCENMKQPVREWDLPLLTSLQRLRIDFCMGGEGEKVWFPSEEEDDGDAWRLIFPSSLTHLRLYNMRKVESLSSGFRNHLSSLQKLGIVDCPKLRYLPEDGLPSSLQFLAIYECEILKDRCLKPTGHYWQEIQEIPVIYMDWVRIR